jgi:hypothetical protein
MNKETDKLLPNQNVVTILSVGGIRAVINTKGIIETNKTIPWSTRKKIEKFLEPGLENILDGWLVEGEIKNDIFYVKYIINEQGKVLDIYETKDWADIMGFMISFSNEKHKFKDMDKSVDVRPESSFGFEHYDSMTTGRDGWRKRVIEAVNNEKHKSV